MGDGLNESDLSDNEDQYSKLADAVSQLDSTHGVRAPTRKEVSSVVSEFHLTKEKTKKGTVVHVNELAAALYNKSASHTEITNKVKSVLKKAKTLPKPLETPVAERIKRAVGYENVKGQLKKWNAIVEKNKVADQLSFPLKRGNIYLQSSHQFLSKFKPATPLEIEMAKTLGREPQEATDDENETDRNLEFPLTFEEMMEKKKELAKMRAKLSYQEAKAYRQSKIKSKKYHRILKRERIKQQLKEFEQLQKTNPEAALKKLEELDKSRARERASLRHKSTGKWARNMAVRAKYDKESRKVLAEQLKLSRDLTAKVKSVADDEDLSDQDNLDTKQEDIYTTTDNPWSLKVSSEVSNFVSECKTYWENKNKENKAKLNSENQISSRAPVEENMANGLSESIDQNCNTSNIGDYGNAAAEAISSDQVTENSRSNNVKTKEKKLWKNQIQTVNSDQYNNSEDSVLKGEKSVSLKKKSKNFETKSNSLDNCSVSKKRKKSPKVSSMKRNNRDGDISPKQVNNNMETEIRSSSGLWSVIELNDSGGTTREKRKNIKDIDDLFEDLEEKLAAKTSKKLKLMKKKYSKKKNVKEKVESDSNDDDDDLAFKNRPIVRPEIDEEMMETTGKESGVKDIGETHSQPIENNFEISSSDAAPPEIDPKKFIEVKPKKLDTQLPDNLTGEEYDYIDDEPAQQMNIIEAFGEDDVVDEFEDMKKEEEENTKLETPGALPGWGSWGGADIEPDERKTKRNMVNVPKLPPRKDKNKKDVIIREKTNPKLLEHMVKDVPHPFKSVGAFESNLRHPVGREWIPEIAHRKFIKKPVDTLMGTIIEPMDESDLLRLEKEKKSLYRGKKKQKT